MESTTVEVYGGRRTVGSTIQDRGGAAETRLRELRLRGTNAQARGRRRSYGAEMFAAGKTTAIWAQRRGGAVDRERKGGSPPAQRELGEAWIPAAAAKVGRRRERRLSFGT
jgi:hypothetical protein